MKTRSYQCSIDAASLLTQVSLVMGFMVCFEPAPSDISVALAFVISLPILRRNVSSLPKVMVVSLPVFILANAVGLIGVASTKSAVRFFGITVYLIAFTVLVCVLSCEKEGLVRKLVNAYMIAALITAALVWGGFLGNIFNLPMLLQMTYDGRPMGLFKDPNVAGSFLMPAALFLSFRLLEENLAKDFILWGVLFFLISALFHTSSRSAVLCWGLGLLVLTVLSGTDLRRKLAHLAIMAGFIIVILPIAHICIGNSRSMNISGRVLPHLGYVRSAVSRAQDYIISTTHQIETEAPVTEDRPTLKADPKRETVQKREPIQEREPILGLYEYDTGGRVYAWRAALELWKTRPLIGAGPGMFEFFSPEIEAELGARYIIPSAHNTYLRVLAENGFLGLVSLLISFVCVLIMSKASGKMYSQWLTASLIALMANGLFLDSLHFRHLWLILALALSRERGPIERSI